MSDNAQPNSLRRDLLRSTHSDTTPTRSEQRQSGARSERPEEGTAMVPARRPKTLGEQLKTARVQQGLELSDVAGITHIRKEYLQALDEGRYNDLPETVYTRNFIRLYAQAIGLDDKELLDLYKREQNGTPEVTEPVVKEPKKPRKVGGRPLRVDLTSMIPMVVLVVVLVGLALWGFNNFFFPLSTATGTTPSQTSGTTASEATTSEATTSGTAASEGSSPILGANIANPRASTATTDTTTADTATSGDASLSSAGTEAATEATGATATEAVPASPADAELVLFSLISSPPGATVTLDNYAFPTTTPIENAPITAGEKTLQVTLEGYQPYEATVDLSFDRSLSVALTPLSEVASEADNDTTLASAADAAAEDSAETIGSSTGQITIQVEQDSWLEVYQGSSRGAGQTLLYRTAESGESFSYDLPVYVHVGNGAGVRISANGTDQGYVGDSGQVIGRAYTQ